MSRILSPIPHDEAAAHFGECDCSYCLSLKAEDVYGAKRLEDERAEREEEERLEGHL
jgi:hypothetical protein